MLTSVAGKSVVVTGASKGIGKGIAGVFAKNGARVLVVGRDLGQAESTAKELGNSAFAFAADVTKLGDMEAMAKTAAERNGGIDVLCANAGIFPQARIEDMSAEQWDEVLSTNLKGTFLAVKACVPYLKKTGAGRIVITSSITGPITGFPGWTHYGASKSGQLGFLRTASIELAKYGITVNAVMPGNIVTEGLEGLGADYLKSVAASIPLKRLGSVEDIGYAALFFASKEAAFITGQTIVVDGGQVLPESPDALMD
jgi:3-oxoacyl-[acyl-carrier protein] reductase